MANRILKALSFKKNRPKSDEPSRKPVSLPPEILREIEIVRPFFDEDFYFYKNPDVQAAGVDPLTHFCVHGWLEDRDPCALFSCQCYKDYAQAYREAFGNPFVHYISCLKPLETNESEHLEDVVEDPAIAAAKALAKNADAPYPTDPLYLTKADGTLLPVKTPDEHAIALAHANMDETYYRKTYPDFDGEKVPAAAHYLTIGWVEGKNPSAQFSTRFYLDNNTDVLEQGVNPFLHYLRHGSTERWRRSSDVAMAEVTARFKKGPLADAFREAVAIEPMVALPRDDRAITSPLSYSEHSLRTISKALRTRFMGRTFRNIVLLPHVRMSGAARVAGCFASALAEIWPAGDTLVVMTDGDMMEHPEWFPPGVELFDFSQFVNQIATPNVRFQMMVDLLHGVEAERLFNVNSRLFWDTLRVYGRQISQEFFVASYLFTWDETPEGFRGGYPIQWLRDCVDVLDLIVCDTASLAEDVRTRFGFAGESAKTVVTLRTPLARNDLSLGGDEDVDGVEPRRDGRPRILWAGRFDRQKRVDLLHEIATRCPQWDFQVYGKAVLDADETFGLDKLDNVFLKGTYTAIDELGAAALDAYLYTSQWDGMPTIILDIAQTGLPIVAADVGGIGEVITDETGWLIAPHDDVDVFIAALQAVIDNPAEGQRRAAALKARVVTLFDPDQYVTDLRTALETANA